MPIEELQCRESRAEVLRDHGNARRKHRTESNATNRERKCFAITELLEGSTEPSPVQRLASGSASRADFDDLITVIV